MDAIEAILSRRSIRKYRKKAVPKELIDELLTAAMQAPSACNEQPWHFVVIDNREILKEYPNAIHIPMRLERLLWQSWFVLILIWWKKMEYGGYRIARPRPKIS